MQFSPYQMVLYPSKAVTLEPSHLHAALQALGLLGDGLGNGRYATGDAFLSLVCFLGCSPDIVLHPHPDQPFCYIALPEEPEPYTFTFSRKPAIITPAWVIIGNIHEAEAVPDTALLETLQAVSGCTWKVGYLH